MSSSLVVADSAREQIAGFVSAAFWVYSIIILAYIVSQLYLNFGGRIPYNTVVRGILDFLSEVTVPFLNIFRRILPRTGPLDLSPILAVITLSIVRAIVVPLIRGY